MPRRAAAALERGALLGMRLLGADEELRATIRRELDAGRAQGPKGRAPNRDENRHGLRIVDLESRRRKLLALHYEDNIGADLFAEEEARLRQQIEIAHAAAATLQAEGQQSDDLAERFEEVAAVLADLDLEAIWAKATQDERRVLVNELLEEVALFPDHLEVVVAGAPRLNVTLEEVGVQSHGVRGGT
jgi:hypothetical protein